MCLEVEVEVEVEVERGGRVKSFLEESLFTVR